MSISSKRESMSISRSASVPLPIPENPSSASSAIPEPRSPSHHLAGSPAAAITLDVLGSGAGLSERVSLSGAGAIFGGSVIHSGYLRKRSPQSIVGLHTWRMRFFEVTRGSVRYYLTHHKIGLLGSIPIERINEIRWQPKKKDGTMFEILTKDRVFVLQAKTRQEAQAWVATMTDVIQSANKEAHEEAARPVAMSMTMRGMSMSIIAPPAGFDRSSFSTAAVAPSSPSVGEKATPAIGTGGSPSATASESGRRERFHTGGEEKGSTFQKAVLEMLAEVFPKESSADDDRNVSLRKLVSSTPFNSELVSYFIGFAQKGGKKELGPSLFLSASDSAPLSGTFLSKPSAPRKTRTSDDMGASDSSDCLDLVDKSHPLGVSKSSDWGSGEEMNLEFAQLQFQELLSKIDARELVAGCFLDSDQVAQAYGIALYWEILKSRMTCLSEHPGSERWSCTKCSKHLKEFYMFTMEYASGEKLTSYMVDILLALLVNGTWEPGSDHDKAMDISPKIQHPEIWKVFFGAIHSSPRRAQKQALREAVALIANSHENAMTITTVKGWQDVLCRLLQDCATKEDGVSLSRKVSGTTSEGPSPIGSAFSSPASSPGMPSKSDHCRDEKKDEKMPENWVMTMSVAVAIHHALLMTSKEFSVTLRKFISTTIQVIGNESGRSTAKNLLRGLFSRIGTGRKFLPGDLMALPWENFSKLLEIACRFIFKLSNLCSYYGLIPDMSEKVSEALELEESSEYYGVFIVKRIEGMEYSATDSDLVDSVNAVLKVMKLSDIRKSSKDSSAPESDRAIINKLITVELFFKDTTPMLLMVESACRILDSDDVKTICKNWYATRNSPDKSREKLLSQLSLATGSAMGSISKKGKFSSFSGKMSLRSGSSRKFHHLAKVSMSSTSDLSGGVSDGDGAASGTGAITRSVTSIGKDSPRAD